MSLGIGLGISPSLFAGQVIGGNGSGAGDDLINENFTTNPGWEVAGTASQNTGRLEASAISGSGNYLTSPVFVQGDEYWGAFDVILDSNFDITTNTQQVSVFRIAITNQMRLSVDAIYFSGVISWQFRIQADGSILSYNTFTPAIPLNTTQRLTVHQKRSSGVSASDGIAQLWVDTTLLYDKSGIDDFDRSRGAEITVGAQDGGSSVTGDIFIDNIKVGTTGSPPA